MEKRLTKRESIIGYGEIWLWGIGLWATSGGLPIPHPTPIYYWFGLGLALVGVCTILYGFLHKSNQLDDGIQEFKGIIPILQKMDALIFKIAKEEAKKIFDLEEYKKIMKKYPIKMCLKWRHQKPKTIKGFKQYAKSWKISLNKTIKEEVHSLRDGANKLEAMSAFLDIHGFGLKQQRLTNRKYLKLSQKLQYYRNLPIGTEIDNLISLHLTYSESNAAMLLTIIRDEQMIIRETETKLLHEVSTNMQIKIEQSEGIMNEVTAKIRAKIGECIENWRLELINLQLSSPPKRNRILITLKLKTLVVMENLMHRYKLQKWVVH